jgi:hypothetical protein
MARPRGLLVGRGRPPRLLACCRLPPPVRHALVNPHRRRHASSGSEGRGGGRRLLPLHRRGSALQIHGTPPALANPCSSEQIHRIGAPSSCPSASMPHFPVLTNRDCPSASIFLCSAVHSTAATHVLALNSVEMVHADPACLALDL